jgi:hypothetical protein
VREQLSRALSELQLRAAEADRFRASADRFRAEADKIQASADKIQASADKTQAENRELQAEASTLRAKLTTISGSASVDAGVRPPPSVRAMLDEALAELQAQAMENSALREKAAAENSALRAELLQLRKETEQVQHASTLFHSVVTVTSKTKMEKTGTSLIHTKPEQLRRLFVEALDQALPSPPSAGAPPPAAIVHAASEKDAAALLYCNLAVRNKGGMASTELFELHLHVAESTETPNLITLRALSDDDAELLGGAEYLRSVEAKRGRVDLRKLKRVQVRSCANGSERQRIACAAQHAPSRSPQREACAAQRAPLRSPQ